MEHQDTRKSLKVTGALFEAIKIQRQKILVIPVEYAVESVRQNPEWINCGLVMQGMALFSTANGPYKAPMCDWSQHSPYRLFSTLRLINSDCEEFLDVSVNDVDVKRLKTINGDFILNEDINEDAYCWILTIKFP